MPTPRALALREGTGPLVQQALAALRPADGLALAPLERDFTLRSSEGFVDNFGATLIERAALVAPGVRLRFVGKAGKDHGPLRDGSVDLETGVIGQGAGPEVKSQRLFEDHFVGVVRAGHPLAGGPVTAAQYAGARHICVTRHAHGQGPVDTALAVAGLARRVATLVDGYGAALSLSRQSDLVATVPSRHSGILRDGMHSFILPVLVPAITVSLLWHPRMDADPAHRWLRALVRDVCGSEHSLTSEMRREPSINNARQATSAVE